MSEILNILYEDSEIIVVEKPPGVPSQGDKTGDRDMSFLVLEYLGEQKPDDEPYAALINRLDRTVGGVTLFGKTKDSAAELSYDLLNGAFSKHYLAVVTGKAKKAATLKDYLLKNERLNISKIVPKNTANSKEAVLHYICLDRVATEEHGVLSLLSVDLETGRHHQIRAQLSNAGIPIWGDTKYNDTTKKIRGFVYPALWSHKLTFKHPKTNKSFTFESFPGNRFPFSLFIDEINK